MDITKIRLVKTKKITSIVLLCLAMLLGTVMIAYAQQSSFTDVKPESWYYNDVEYAVELGIINGKTATTFAPDDYLTYAEAAKLAACMNESYTKGEITLKSGSDVWYETYTNYCFANGIMEGSYNFGENATRAGYMEIFARALPEEALKPVNNVPDGSIPDVDINAKYADEIYILYRAGILQGSDALHSCKPNDNIKRSEVAAILTRMMNPEKRIRFSMGTEEQIKPLAITYHPQDADVKPGNQIAVGVTANGGKEPYSYRWQIYTEKDMNGGNVWRYLDEAGTPFIKSANEKILTMAFPDTLMASVKLILRCEITDALGNVINSDSAVINCESPLRVLEQPKGTESVTGETASVSVEAIGGTAPYSYRWMLLLEENQTWGYIDGLNETYRTGFDGLTEATLTYKSTEAATKRVRCEITDANGKTILSNEVSIVINSVPDKAEDDSSGLTESKDGDFRFILNRGDQYPFSGNDIYYEYKVIGGKAPLKYQWEVRSGRNFVAIVNNTEGVKGSNTATLSYTFYPTRVINGETIRLTITDADGKTASSEPFTTPLGTFVMDVQDKMNISTASGVEGTIVSGRILDGTVVPGQNIFVYSEELGLCMTGTVSRIEMFGKSLDKAEKGDYCGLLLSKDNIVKVESGELMEMLPGNSSARSIIMNSVSKGLAINVSFGTGEVMNAKGNPGKNVTLSVSQVNGGTAPYTYRWMSRKKDSDDEYKELESGEHYMSVDTSELTVKTEISDYETEFICRVTDSSGKEVFTKPAYIYPEKIVLVEKPPVQTYANYGDNVTLKVKAYASAYVANGGKTIAEGTLSYHWQYYSRGLYGDDYVNIGETDTWASGYDTPELTLSMERLLFNHSTVYRCVITDQNKNEVRTEMVYVVPEKPLIINSPDSNIYALVGEWASIKIEANGKYTPLTYRWQFTCDAFDGNFLDISKDHPWAKGIDTNELKVFVEKGKYDDSLRFKCIVTDAQGNVQSTRTYRLITSESPDVSLKG